MIQELDQNRTTTFLKSIVNNLKTILHLKTTWKMYFMKLSI